MGDAAPLARAGLRVAVIEDDPALRRRMKGILGGAGYGVFAVANGEVGLRVVHEHESGLLPAVESPVGLLVDRDMPVAPRSVTAA